MILRILLLTCAICISPSLGKLDFGKFGPKFEEMCFQNEETDPFRINGQETPLSNTLENFIAMAEKFEAANPTFDLKDQLVYFITEYLFENIKFLNRRVVEWKLGLSDLATYDSLWDPDQIGYKATPNDPFTDAEKCSLYYMISHSIIKNGLLQKSFVSMPRNFSSPRVLDADLNAEEFYPQEIGVVSIRGTDAAVQLSKVLLGLYVGLKPDRKAELTSFECVQKLNVPEDKLPQDRILDAVYTVTMADVLMRAEWDGSDRQGLAPNGKWASIPITEDKKIDGFCPMVYTQQLQNGKSDLPAYSYSSVRGAADGLILGLAASPIFTKKSTSRLSQILRMYYSPDGISVDSSIEDINEQQISFCNRRALMDSVERKLQDQMLSYGYLIAQSIKGVDTVLREAKDIYSNRKGEIFDNSNTEIRDYCDRPTSLDKPEDLPRESSLDIIVVMDTSNSENSFQEQQLITGYLAKYLELRYTGSRMTILLDQTNTQSISSSGKIDLKTVVMDTYSSSCAACTVGQIEYEPSTLARDQLIIAIDQFLHERKENETKYNGVNGKIVVYFNYQNENGGNNNKIQGGLEKALRNLHLNHQDVVFYAVGLDSELLKRYAKNDPSLIFLGTDGTQDEVAKRIYQKISLSPSLLQYTDCEEARNEKTAYYENFVSPHTIQHYEMPAEYFYKSTSITFTFESQNGYVRVCHNRATKRPELELKNCKNTTGTAGIDFKISNPCKSFSKTTCSPFFFSVMGMNSNSQEMKSDTRQRDYCTDIPDQWCRTLDQIKFKVSHTGVRCSGCLGLVARPAIMIATVLLAYFMYKKF